MKFEDGKIKPCPTCYRVRQQAKNAIDRVTGRSHRYSVVTTTIGKLVIDKEDGNKIVKVNRDDWQHMVGLEAYLSGFIVYDLKATKPLNVGNVVAVIRNNEGNI